ncbi:MAG: Universal stress protein [Acidobacteria bacterium ADurb.Bin340]|nr:MAG: Universal stress protein [Acidobacteria bacterium ADurb.Bin340]HQL48802.1 universal stress protein [Holophaga sp.]
MPESNAAVWVASDFSSASDEAVRQADAWATRIGRPLVACHVLPELLRVNPLFPERAQAQQESLDALREHVLAKLERQMLTVTRRQPGEFQTVVEVGQAPSALVRLAEREAMHLLVIGAEAGHGLGSTARRVMHYAPVSVLVARPVAHPGHVLAATDLSDPAVPAVEAGVLEARVRGARLTVLHCLEMPVPPLVDTAMGFPAWASYTERELQGWRESGRQRLEAMVAGHAGVMDLRCELGEASQVILETAVAERSELVVVGSHGHSGIRRVLLGSVAERVVEEVQAPVLVVRLKG